MSAHGRNGSTSWTTCWKNWGERRKEMEAVRSSGPAKITLPTDEQILITREFGAPRRHVYKAWTTPELVKRWWGGHRGETTVAEIDLRVGGTWRCVMVTNDGAEVVFHGEYREIVPNERIVSTEVYEGMVRSEEHTSELQSRQYLVCRLLLEKKETHVKAELHYLVDQPECHQFEVARYNDPAVAPCLYPPHPLLV